jgi:hypothetical protein
MQRTIKVQARTLLVQAGDLPEPSGRHQPRRSTAKPLNSLLMISFVRSREQLARRLLPLLRGHNGVSTKTILQVEPTAAQRNTQAIPRQRRLSGANRMAPFFVSPPHSPPWPAMDRMLQR